MSEPNVAALQKRVAALVSSNETKANELKRVNRAAAATEKELNTVQRELDLIKSIESHPRQKQIFKSPAKKTDKWHATPIFVSSDLQLGEVVTAGSMHGFNAYDNAIAAMRFQYAAESVVKMTRDGMPKYNYDGLVVVLNGDPVSNNIHEELQETNQGSVLETVNLAYELHEAMLRLFVENYPKVLVIATPSNHGRTHRQTPHKQQARSSYDWLIAKMLQRAFKDDDRVVFQISDANEEQFRVYDKVYSAEHGHWIKGAGDGVAGIGPSMGRARMRRAQRDQGMGRPVDHYLFSHFHQLVFGNGWTLNGSYIGYNEYASDLALIVGKPEQALLVATPERGISLSLGIDCEAPGERKLWPSAGRNSW